MSAGQTADASHAKQAQAGFVEGRMHAGETQDRGGDLSSAGRLAEQLRLHEPQLRCDYNFAGLLFRHSAAARFMPAVAWMDLLFQEDSLQSQLNAWIKLE